MDQAASVLVVEDDPTVRNLIAHALSVSGHEVAAAATAAEALRLARATPPALALLDVRLGGAADGLELARQLQDVSDAWIVFVTGAVEPEDISAGFAAGGDMYVEKPFSVEKLLARVDALLLRNHKQPARRWEVADLVVDEEARVVTRSGRVVRLQPREFDLLCALVQRSGKVVSKQELLTQVWEYDGFVDNVVEQRISSLRRKLEAHGPRLLHTVWGVGYTLRP